MRLPGFNAEASLFRMTGHHAGEAPSPELAEWGVVPAGGPPGGMECLRNCIDMAFPVGTTMDEEQLENALKTCAVICGIEYTDDLWQRLLAWKPPGYWAQFWARFGRFIWRGWGPTAATGAAALVGIGLGTLLGYEIEKHGWLAPDWPKSAAPASGCVPVGPDTHHMITESSHWGCARSESLARIAAENDCQARTNRCLGKCPTGTPCTPHAKVWNTATVQAGGFTDALVNGCSTSAYYTCECGCP